MSNKVQREIGEYTCEGDDGRTYYVMEYQEFTQAVTEHGEDWLPGLKWFQLINGRKVNVVSDGVFTIVATGVTVRKR